ncbi:MAG: AAA family ATPase [Patescibacteria group bacterium]
MRLKKLTIKGFRGFNDEQHILLDSNVILVYGLNGSGKSSFTEALEWLFFGEISRQRLSRCKSEYQYEEYLRNLFYISSDNPFVEVEGTIAGTSVVVRKEIMLTGERFLIDGKEVANLETLNLNFENYFRPMLAQTEIKALVDSEQKDRWEQLSSILGQDNLTRLRENLITLRNTKKDENYRKQETRWNSIISDTSELSSLATLLPPIQDLDENHVLNELGKIVVSKAKSFERLSEEIKVKQKSLLNTELGKRVAEVSYKDSTELKSFLEEVSDHFKKLEDEAIKSTYGGHDHSYLDFLKSGRNFAKPPECPFCLEKTLAEKRLQTIDKSLEQGKEAQEAKSQFNQWKSAIDIWLISYQDRLKVFLPSQQELRIISQKFLDIGEEELATFVQELDKIITNIVEKSGKDATTISEAKFTYLETKYFHKQKVEEDSKEKLGEFVSRVLVQNQGIITEWENLKTKIAEKLPLSGQMDQEELKKWLTLEKISNFFAGAETFILQADLLKKIDVIQEKLEKYEKTEVTRLLSEHAQEIKNYYEKLNPGDQIQFSGIEVKDGIRRQAKLKAEAFGKEVNPVTFFSEAHANSLALSIYFPQRVDRNTTWETVILDDPVQSMDENHSQALIDILFNISTKKQVIVLTHSKSFFRRLCARFGHLKPKTYLFFYNEDVGPSVVLDEGETLAHLAIAGESRKKGDMRSLESASEQLRKAIESICFEFLLDKGASFSKAQKVQKGGFDSLFSEAEKLGLPASETGKLKSLLDMSHNNSHAWSIADTTSGGITKGIQYIQDIYDAYLK